MPKINIDVTGNGTAWVDNDDPNTGETVTLYCIPDVGATLDNVDAVDLEGHSIALAVQEEQTFTYGSYSGMIIYVTFIGGPTPPTPTTSTKRHMPIWMYPSLRQRR